MSELAGSRVAVTGAMGCIGRAVVRQLLANGAEVVALVRPGSPAPPGCARVPLELGDQVSVTTAIAAASPDLVVNAGLPAGHPTTREARDALLRAGLLGTTALLDASAAQGVRRLVHVGSSLEVGSSPGPRRESDTTRPTTFRGIVKAAQTALCLEQCSMGVPAVVVRPFTVYGPAEQPHRFVPTALRAALKGDELRLPARPAARDFVFVDDVARGILAALVTPAAVGQVVNLGTGRETSLEEVVAAIEEVTGSTIRLSLERYPARTVDGAFGVADTRHARDVLGWSARIRLREGLAITVDSLRRAA